MCVQLQLVGKDSGGQDAMHWKGQKAQCMKYRIDMQSLEHLRVMQMQLFYFALMLPISIVLLLSCIVIVRIKQSSEKVKRVHRLSIFSTMDSG